MKKNLLFVALLFASTLGFAAEPKVVLDFSQTPPTEPAFPTAYVKDAATYEYSISETETVTLNFNESSNGHKCGTGVLMMGKKNASLTLSAFDFAVQKMVITGGSSASEKVEVNIFVGDEEVSTKTVGLKTTQGNREYLIDSKYRTAGNQYTIKVLSDQNAQISKLEIYEAVAGAPDEPQFSVAEGVFISDVEVELTSPTQGAEIYYTINGEAPTTESTKYSEPIVVKVGEESKIQAIAVLNDMASTVATAVYKVVEVSGNGTEENPFSVADVIALDAKFNNTDKQWVIGYVGGALSSNSSLPTGKVVIDNESTSNVFISDELLEEGKDTVIIAVKINNTAVNGAVNVKDHPDVIGKQVKFYGSISTKYFSMPGVESVTDHVILDEPWVRPVFFDITLDKVENGTIATDPAEKAAAGSTVNLVADPADGYKVEAWKVTTADGDVEVKDNSFVMPEADVTISATFVTAPTFDITIAAAEHGKVEASKAKATEGTTITLTITPDEGYSLDQLTVTDADKKEVEVKDGKFVMPAAAVTITATFRLYSLADFMKEKPEEAKTIGEDLTVIFASGAYVYFTNGELYMSIYDKDNTNINTSGLKNGDVLKNLTGKYGEYKNHPQMTLTKVATIEKGTQTVPSQEITAAPTAADANKLVKLTEAQVTADADGKKFFVFSDVQIYDTFGLKYEIAAGTYTFEGIVIVFNTTIEIAPIAAPVREESGIEDVEVRSLDLNAPMFNVLGVQVDANYRGVVIQNGQKYILR